MPGAQGDGQSPPAPPGVDSEAWQKAMTACASLSPSGGGPAPAQETTVALVPSSQPASPARETARTSST